MKTSDFMSSLNFLIVHCGSPLVYLLTSLLVSPTPAVLLDLKTDYTFPDGVNLKDGDTFEYIVVGAGAGGAAAAANLALRGADVLLLEAGGNPNLISRNETSAGGCNCYHDIHIIKQVSTPSSSRHPLVNLIALLFAVPSPATLFDLKSNFSFPDGVHLKDGDTYEYIVVGAGAGGASAAARLALYGANVLLLEAGGDPTFISRIPSVSLELLGTNIDYAYDTISNNVSCLSYRNQQCRFSRGKCLGGSTSINNMIYTRGNPKDFDDLNITGWTWKDVEPYFLRYEGMQDLDLLPPSSVPYHNTKGMMKMEFFSDSGNPWHSRLIEGLMSLNFPFNPDVNARSQIGVTQVVGYVYNGERMSTARGYLGRADVKRKLKVAKYTKCTGVIIDDDNVAQGVTVAFGALNINFKLYASKEVILSAGALITPQILMLSGIGMGDHLKDMNIPVRADLPVGDNMIDHAFPLIFVKVKGENGPLKAVISTAAKIANSLVELLKSRNGPLTSIGLTDISAFANTLCYDFDKHQLMNNSAECRLPTMQIIHSFLDKYLVTAGEYFFKRSTDLNDAVTKQLAAINAKHALLIMSPLVLQPKSRGRVRLSSPDPLTSPFIFPNYLTDERDVNEMVRACRIIEQVTETPTFRAQNASVVILELEGCPEHGTDSEGYWRCYVRHMTHSTFHSVGTTALGRVVDSRLRVRGVDRLRVADIGVLPVLPRGNTAAAGIAIGERVVDFIKEYNTIDK